MSTLRPSFGEREAFRSALAQAYAEGRIDDAEFEKRTTTLESCTTVSGLRRALADLPQPSVSFPKTVTRTDAQKWQRGRGTNPSIKRRAALGLGAVVTGFLIAGGGGQLVGSLPEPGPALDEITEPNRPNYLTDAKAIDAALAEVGKRGFTDFISINFYDGHLSISVRSPKNPRGYDDVSVFELSDIDVRPSGQFEEEWPTFTAAEVDAEIVVEMARVAPQLTDGVVTSHLGLGTGTASAYVDGDDYGNGGGRIEWTADGKKLLSISRNGE